MIEVVISLAVMAILLVSVFSITVETSAFVANNDTDAAVQAEVQQGMNRLTELLRKCGWNTAAGTTYPRVTSSGNALQFRRLQDLDGNGYPFDAATGGLEWAATVYEIRVDGSGNLQVFAGGAPVWHLCRFVSDVDFATYLEVSSLALREIQVTVRTQRLNRRGETLGATLSGTVDMRN